MVLQRIEIPPAVADREIALQIRRRINNTIDRIQVFQDRWDRPQIELFVAADYNHVFQVLSWTVEDQPMIGRRFLEWGCGFAAVTAMAASLGLDAIGIEAEQELLLEAGQTMAEWGSQAELIAGNFLPPGAESLADDSMLPSLGHRVRDGYAELGMDLDDFAIVYTYPWPGEDNFHELVFDRYAATGALLLVFYGPYDIGLWRKTK